jgi:HNH/Endo VII superfamily toxin with a SHH signature
MQAHYIDYVHDAAPAILMDTQQHYNTYGAFNTWRSNYPKIGPMYGDPIDWISVTKDEMMKLAELQFDAAAVPAETREHYLKEWAKYVDTLTPR